VSSGSVEGYDKVKPIAYVIGKKVFYIDVDVSY
jgi:hypothetical protein